MLLAAAHHTGLLATLDTALLEAFSLPQPLPQPQPGLNPQPIRLSRTRSATRHRLMATLLFLPVASLARPWDLRSYTGKLLALLSNRGERTYSYRHTERFLAEAAKLGCDRTLTPALARWTTQLWHRPGEGEGEGVGMGVGMSDSKLAQPPSASGSGASVAT